MGQEIPPSSQDTRRGCGGMESEVGDVGVRRPEHCTPLSPFWKINHHPLISPPSSLHAAWYTVRACTHHEARGQGVVMVVYPSTVSQ